MLGRSRGNAVFDHERGRALIRQYEDDQENCIQLACSVARFCQFAFATIATFLVKKLASSGDGEDKYQVELLNGWMSMLDSPIDMA